MGSRAKELHLDGVTTKGFMEFFEENGFSSYASNNNDGRGIHLGTNAGVPAVRVMGPTHVDSMIEFKAIEDAIWAYKKLST